MPTMKIRDDDLDLVEYESNSFTPGWNLKTFGCEKKEAAGKNIYLIVRRYESICRNS